mgnify:CR=1 FL=1
MANEIYISYRRNDTAAEARQLYQALARRYDRQTVVMDIEAIAVGETIVSRLAQILGEAKVFIVIIGRRWADGFHGERAGRNPDFVQMEIERALARGIAIIPVLVAGASMPSETEIPSSLAGLLLVQSAILRRDRFEDDVRRLIAHIEQVLRVQEPDGIDEPLERAGHAPTADAEEAVQAGARPHPPAAPRAGATAIWSALATARPSTWFPSEYIRPLAAALAWIALLAAAIYGLARVAVASLPPADVAWRPMPGDARLGANGPIAVALDDRGAARLIAERGSASSFGGRAEQARITADGHELVTTGLDGAVRARRVDGFGAGMISSFTALSPAWHQHVWPAFGQPLADSALQLAAQFVSFDIPEAARGRRGRAFRDCKDDVCGPLMVEVGPGRFFTGSAFAWRGDGPRRIDTIAAPFAIARFETTRGDWSACFVDGACSWRSNAASEADGGTNHPIGMVNWDDAAVQYVTWLNRKLGLSGPLAYRLPTAAEWEYAAQDDLRPSTSSRDGSTAAFPVGTRSSGNRLSLRDMDGNLAEWVSDCSSQGTPGEAPGACTLRAVRGRSWRGDLDAALLATTQRDDLGFRLARGLPP